MPSLHRPALLLLPAVLLLALAFCWPVLAGPPDGYEVVITEPDGDERYPWLSQGAPDLVGKYPVRRADGSIVRVDTTGGVSIASLFRFVGAQNGYEMIVIRRRDDRTFSLTRDEIESDIQPPGFFTDDATGKTMFIGYPPAGELAVEARDYFEVRLSGLRIDQAAKARVSVDLKASKAKIDPGQSVTFTATARPRRSYRYDWTLESGVTKKKEAGSEDSGSKVAHRFDEEGRFNVVVDVYTSDDDSDSDRAVVPVQVGDPKQSDKDREGGGDNKAPGAPSSGPSTGSSGAATAPVPPPTDPGTPPSSDISPTTDTPVTGNLLADASDPPSIAIVESAARAVRDGNPSDDRDAGAAVPEAALSIACALTLLALGAAIENRQGRRLSLKEPRLRTI